LNYNNTEYNYSPNNSVCGEEINYNNKLKNILNKLAINSCLKYSLISDLFDSQNFTHNNKTEKLSLNDNINNIEETLFIEESESNQVSQEQLSNLINNFVELYDCEDNNFKFFRKIEFSSFENLISSILKINKNSNNTKHFYNKKNKTNLIQTQMKNKSFEDAIIENFFGEEKNSELNLNNPMTSDNYNKELQKLYHTDSNSEFLDKKRKR